MSIDPLAAFRKRSGVGHVETATPVEEAEGYLAFAAKERVDRLKIHLADNLTHAPDYKFLVSLVYDGDFGTHCTLVFTIHSVKLAGRNLLPVIKAIQAGTADFIRQYDADKWPKPNDNDAPFIESIEVIQPDSETSGTLDF